MQIIVNNLAYSYGKVRRRRPTVFAIKDISLTITAGEFVAVVGHSGAGKTTFIEHLNGLIKPVQGSIKINEFLIDSKQRKIHNVKELRKTVGVVFQFSEYQLFEDTILKEIIFGPVNMGVNKDVAIAAAKRYIKIVGLDESFLSRSPFELSGGQKRRVAIASILALEPDFLVLDEPVAGLDPQGEKDIYKIFTDLNARGKTIIVVTHDLEHALKYAERTLVLNHGHLVRDERSIDLIYDTKALLDYELDVPNIVLLVRKLEACGFNIGKVRSVEELAKRIALGRKANA